MFGTMYGFSRSVCAAVVGLALVSPAWSATVFCNGVESGGANPAGTLYAYEVNLGGGELMTQFEVGTHCANPGHYGNWWTTAPGWAPVGAIAGFPQPDWPGKTPHGGLSPGPTGTCPTAVLWTGPALVAGSYWFGFDNVHESHDVGWTVSPTAVPSTENWAAPVGTGAGPVHGPIPEPTAIALLSLGGLALMRRRR